MRPIGVCSNCSKTRALYPTGLCDRCYRSTHLIVCKSCGKTKSHGGLGMCRVCYLRETGIGKESVKSNRAKVKKAVFDAYGNKCACCGETEQSFLTIDHVNDDGAEHRKSLNGHNKASSTMYRDILKQGCPKDKYQILCANCNQAKRLLGYCPHQRSNK